MFSNLSRVDTLAGAVIAAAWGAASQLGVPALYPATEVFFERSASGAMPSTEQALANWTAAKAKLPSSGVLGFFLGVRLLSAASVAWDIYLS